MKGLVSTAQESDVVLDKAQQADNSEAIRRMELQLQLENEEDEETKAFVHRFVTEVASYLLQKENLRWIEVYTEFGRQTGTAKMYADELRRKLKNLNNHS